MNELRPLYPKDSLDMQLPFSRRLVSEHFKGGYYQRHGRQFIARLVRLVLQSSADILWGFVVVL